MHQFHGPRNVLKVNLTNGIFGKITSKQAHTPQRSEFQQVVGIRNKPQSSSQGSVGHLGNATDACSNHVGDIGLNNSEQQIAFITLHTSGMQKNNVQEHTPSTPIGRY